MLRQWPLLESSSPRLQTDPIHFRVVEKGKLFLTATFSWSACLLAVDGRRRSFPPMEFEYRGLLHKNFRFETYPPVGPFPRGWYVYRVDGVDGPEEMERN